MDLETLLISVYVTVDDWWKEYRSTARLLTVLKLLQARKMTGAEIARRLEVDARTVRRYVASLQEMGIPVEGEWAATAPTPSGGATRCLR